MKSLVNLTKSFFYNLEQSDSELPKDEIDCFNRAMDKFCNSGKKSDAFVVFFCFSEIFCLFGKGYENTQKLLELLADHEFHAGELLVKHRDHYVHSAYVFALGLALYAGDDAYRREFCSFYGLGKGDYGSFLYLWGLTALFHDIGYPFQLAHEQIKEYTTQLFGKKDTNPFVSFGNLEKHIMLDKAQSEYLQSALGVDQDFANLDELLAYGLHKRKGYEKEIVVPLLKQRVVSQSKFLDHGYFSALLLGNILVQNKAVSMATLDVLTAHLLHNNFNKYDYPQSKRSAVSISEHPLAYMLILCDELQAWDRTAYGHESKKEPLPWNVKIAVSSNMVDVTYIYESFTVKNLGAVPPTLDPIKSVDKINSGAFARDIYSFIKSKLLINASCEQAQKEKNQARFTSNDSFTNLCDFAIAAHASYLDRCNELDKQHIQNDFGDLPLEFKISNIEQAKSYAEKLEQINCFYSDKDLDYTVVEQFSSENNIDPLTGEKKDDIGFLCREEHIRWVKEKLDCGWKYGNSYISNGKINYSLRQQRKEHADIVPYDCLSQDEKAKDAVLVENMIPLLYRLGGNTRIYRYRYGRKQDLNVAAIGHRDFVGDREQIKAKIKEILKEYAKNYRVIVRSCFAFGADQLIAECAAELNITLKAELPMSYEELIEWEYNEAKVKGYTFGKEQELNMRHLLAQTAVCNMLQKSETSHLEAAKKIINRCDKVIAIWDGIQTKLYDGSGNPSNRGGTYHCLHMAKNRGLKESDIHIISVER